MGWALWIWLWWGLRQIRPWWRFIWRRWQKAVSESGLVQAMTIFWTGRVNEQFTIVTIVMKMKTNMTMMAMTRGSGQNQGWSTFPSIDGPPARLGTHHTLMTRMTMAKWRWQNDSDNKKWPWFNQILFTIMETFIHDSGNSDVHSKDDNVLLYNNLPQIFFVIIVFCICFSSCILSLLSYACAGTQMGGRCLLCGNYYKVCHQRDTYNQTHPVLQLLLSIYLQQFGQYGPNLL